MIRFRGIFASALVWGLVVLQSACSNTASGVEADANPNISDSGFISGEITSGIGLRFEVSPDFGETFEHSDNTISIDSAWFTIVDLRLIGDAASGDGRTSKDVVELAWDSGKPVEVGYGDAPPGIYSRVRGTVVEFAIAGQVERDGDSATYSAEQASVALPIDFELNLSLEAGKGETVVVEVDLGDIAEEISFEDLPIEDGIIEIEDGSEAMIKIEEKISEAFSLDN